MIDGIDKMSVWARLVGELSIGCGFVPVAVLWWSLVLIGTVGVVSRRDLQFATKLAVVSLAQRL